MLKNHRKAGKITSLGARCSGWVPNTQYALLFKKCHKKSADNHQDKSKRCLFRKLFFKYEVRKYHCYNNTQLINGHYHADNTMGYCIIIAKPRGSRCDTRERNKEQLLFINGFQSPMFPPCKDDYPGKHKYHGGTDCSTEI